MRLASVLFIFAAMTAALLTSGSRQEPSTRQPGTITVYDANPDHLWNRLYQALLVREGRHGSTYGVDSPDPLLWIESEHLLAEPSHTRALRVLDEFVQSHGENLIRDPLKRVMLQRDLWAVFDWSVQQYSSNGRPRYEREKRELQIRLAEVLGRLALSPKEIESLPDNYAQAVASGAFAKQYDPANRERPFLPPDLLDPKGSWVAIWPDIDPVAISHVTSVSGRSSFSVLIHLPGGRKETFDYLQSLWNFPQPWVQRTDVPDANDQTVVNPDLPSFPAGTEVALVRGMTIFDNKANIKATSIVESVQIRVYREIRARPESFSSLTEASAQSGQDFYQFTVSRPLLFANKEGGLRPTGRDERELSTFQQQGDDWIEEMENHPQLKDKWPPAISLCVECHHGPGVRSLNSLKSLLRPSRRQQEPANAAYGPRYWEDTSVLTWKENRYDWGLLNGYWKASASVH